MKKILLPAHKSARQAFMKISQVKRLTARNAQARVLEIFSVSVVREQQICSKNAVLRIAYCLMRER